MESLPAQASGSTSGGNPPGDDKPPGVPPIVSPRKRKRLHRSQKQIRERKLKHAKEEAESSDTTTISGKMADTSTRSTALGGRANKTPSRSPSPKTMPLDPIDESESPSPREISKFKLLFCICCC